MPDPASDDVARNRFVIINFVRLAGTVLTVFSMLILGDAIDGSYPVGYLLVGLGLFAIFAGPLMLARRWRSPRDSDPE